MLLRPAKRNAGRLHAVKSRRHLHSQLSSQTASRSVQPFSARLMVVTDRQSNRSCGLIIDQLPVVDLAICSGQTDAKKLHAYQEHFRAMPKCQKCRSSFAMGYSGFFRQLALRLCPALRMPSGPHLHSL